MCFVGGVGTGCQTSLLSHYLSTHLNLTSKDAGPWWSLLLQILGQQNGLPRPGCHSSRNWPLESHFRPLRPQLHSKGAFPRTAHNCLAGHRFRRDDWDKRTASRFHQGILAGSGSPFASILGILLPNWRGVRLGHLGKHLEAWEPDPAQWALLGQGRAIDWGLKKCVLIEKRNNWWEMLLKDGNIELSWNKVRVGREW